MEIARSKLLDAIGRVVPAIAKKETFEQANRMAFDKGYLVSYNDSVSIFAHLPELAEISGAIDGKKLFELLTKMTAETVTLTVEGDKLKVSGGRIRATFDMLTVLLPIGELDQTGTAVPLPESFGSALRLVMGGCARDMSRPILTCIRLEGVEIEAADGFRAIRFKVPEANLPKVLLPVMAAEIIVGYKVESIAVGDMGQWVRFWAHSGTTVIHARVMSGEYPDLSAHYDMDGEAIKFPETLGGVLERAQIFAKRESKIDEEVGLAMTDNQITVTASCDGVQFSEIAQYEGQTTASFYIHPQFLDAALKAGNTCVVGNGRIKFIGDNWEHVIALR